MEMNGFWVKKISTFHHPNKGKHGIKSPKTKKRRPFDLLLIISSVWIRNQGFESRYLNQPSRSDLVELAPTYTYLCT